MGRLTCWRRTAPRISDNFTPATSWQVSTSRNVQKVTEPASSLRYKSATGLQASA